MFGGGGVLYMVWFLYNKNPALTGMTTLLKSDEKFMKVRDIAEISEALLHVAKATKKRVFILQMWWPVRGWGTPPESKGKSPHLYPAHRKGGPNAPLFRYPASGPLSGWLVARLFLSGDVERNPGPGKKWLCTLCNLATHQNKTTNIYTLQSHHNTLGTLNMHKLNPVHKHLEMHTTLNTHHSNPTFTKRPLNNHIACPVCERRGMSRGRSAGLGSRWGLEVRIWRPDEGRG